MGKTDSTGTYAYVCDGTSPGSPILSDGQAVYTPGLSERRNGASLFYNSDDLGNLWTADDGTGKAEAGAYLFTGFGASLYAGAGAASASPLKYGGANDCQTDYDTGLVMMGFRYYDTRTGRFISQDPVKSGSNWYAYADDSPSSAIDPMGLDSMDITVPPNGTADIIYTQNGHTYDSGVVYTNNTDQAISITIDTDTMSSQTFNPSNSPAGGSDSSGGGGMSFGGGGGGALGAGMFAGVMGNFGKGFSAIMKENQMAINFGKFATQGAARNSTGVGLFGIYGGVQYILNPQPGFVNNATASVMGYYLD